ncbi:PQQ-binding-like beta-propeller repeat protein [Candidatus Latescibacterota bacterium]
MKKTYFIVLLIALAACFVCACGSSGTQPEEFTFVVISDVHVPSYGAPIGIPLDEESLMEMHNQKRIRQFVEECLAMDPRPDFVVNNGDTGDAGWVPLLALYQKLMRPLVDSGIPVYTTVGNHDLDYAGIGVEDLAGFFDPLGPALIGRGGTRYSFDHKGAHFVFMNNRPVSGLIRFNPEDLTWLQNDLEHVDKDTPVLLVLHANMRIDDTHRVVEILQKFKYPTVFQGHRHSEGIEAWGGVPVVLTGSLYSGTPEAGSFRVVTVKPDTIVVRTRDFAQPAGTLEPEEIVEYFPKGPELHVTDLENESFVEGSLTLKVETYPVSPGIFEYSIPGFTDWTELAGENGKWADDVSVPADQGRYFIAMRFTGENGSIVLGHRTVKTSGGNVKELWAKDLGSAMQAGLVINGNLAVVPTVEGGVFALDINDGTEVWHRTGDGGQIIGRMVSDGESVYYCSGRVVYRCDASTGETVWERKLQDTVIAGLTIVNGKLFAPAGHDKLYCIDAGNSNILWDYTVRLPIIMEVETDSEQVYFGSMDGRIRALDIETGGEVWSIQWAPEEDSYVTAPFWPPVVAGDRIVIGKNPAEEGEKNLAAFSTSNGEMIWSGQSTAWRLRMALNARKNRFYVSYSEERGRGVRCLNVSDGSTVWSGLADVAMNAAAVSGDDILVRDDYSVCCLDTETGSIRWSYRSNTGPQGSLYGPGAMAVRDGLAIVGTMDGQILALKW